MAWTEPRTASRESLRKQSGEELKKKGTLHWSRDQTNTQNTTHTLHTQGVPTRSSVWPSSATPLNSACCLFRWERTHRAAGRYARRQTRVPLVSCQHNSTLKKCNKQQKQHPVQFRLVKMCHLRVNHCSFSLIWSFYAAVCWASSSNIKVIKPKHNYLFHITLQGCRCYLSNHLC